MFQLVHKFKYVGTKIAVSRADVLYKNWPFFSIEIGRIPR